MIVFNVSYSMRELKIGALAFKDWFHDCPGPIICMTLDQQKKIFINNKHVFVRRSSLFSKKYLVYSSKEAEL